MADILTRRLDGVVVVLETVYRRHNVSAILRSAECFGIHEVHLVSNGFRPSKGAARGSERWLDVRIDSDTVSCVRALQARGFRVWAADLAPNAVSPVTLPLDGPVAILMGAELSGVSEAARTVVDGFVSVPMQGMTESLNVSVAAACILSRLTERLRGPDGAGDMSAERQASILDAWAEREAVGVKGRSARASLHSRMGSDGVGISEKALDKS